MADTYTGKYLDGAGLNILWSKIKSDFQPKGNYQPAGNYATIEGNNTFSGVNKFTNAAGITATKFVMSGGTASQLLLADGTTKAVSTFQPAGSYAVLGKDNTFTGINTFDNDIRIESNIECAGHGYFIRSVSASGFKATTSDGEILSGFLKADGSVDTNDYALSNHNHDGIYQPVGEYATLGGANTFTNDAGITAKKFVMSGGTASQLLLANGATKAVSDFATAGHDHDDRYALKNHNHDGVYQPVGDYAPAKDYAVRGEANNFTELNTFAKAVTIGSIQGREFIGESSLPAYLTVHGTGDFDGYVTAAGFQVSGQTGFLKANGTVDTTSYQPAGSYAELGKANTFAGAITATGFKVSGKTGFLKADGSVDSTSYQPAGSYAPAKNYAVRGEANTFTEKNEFTHADGVEAKKFVVTGGTNANLLLANGGFKPVSDLATTDALTAATGRISTIEDNYIKKDGSVAMTGALKATSITLSTAITENAQATTKKYVDDKVSNAITALNNVIKLKGSVGTAPVVALPDSAELGDAYVVSKAGEYAGEVCEVGDMIVCTSKSPLAWTIIQRNIPGVLTTDDLNDILK